MFIFNNSATMVRQGGHVQLEHSDRRLGFNLANMATAGLPRTAIDGTQYQIKKPRAEVREEKKRGVDFVGHQRLSLR